MSERNVERDSELERRLQNALPLNGFSKWAFRIVTVMVPVMLIGLFELSRTVSNHNVQIDILSTTLKETNAAMAMTVKDNNSAVSMAIKDVVASLDKLNNSGTAGLCVERVERQALGDRVTRAEQAANTLNQTLIQMNARLGVIGESQVRLETLLGAHMTATANPKPN
jgi:hypothetical protein